MKRNDCKLIRREIDESEFGQELSSDVMQHIDGCNSCRDFFESGKKVRQIVASLTPVEAPADFDFRLSARLAQTSGRRFHLPSFSLAFPSAVVAVVILAVGGVFILRNAGTETRNKTAVTLTPEAAPREAKVDTTTTNNETTSKPNQTANAIKAKPIISDKKPAYSKRSEVARRRGRVIEQDFSSVGARIVKSEQPLVGIQPQLVFPMQTLTVSVDDAKGVSRTISFPTVSFGSQRVLAGNGSSFQTPTRTNW